MARAPGLKRPGKDSWEVFVELKEGNPDDDLRMWATTRSVERSLVRTEELGDLVNTVVRTGYSGDLTDIELEKLGHDPFLIAYALRDRDNRCVVSQEKSKPTRKRANRFIPDVCRALDVAHLDTFRFLETLDFRTNWADQMPSDLFS